MSDHLCTLCRQPMPAGEEMFKFHGFSGPCPVKRPMKLHFTNEALLDMIENGPEEPEEFTAPSFTEGSD